MTNVARYPDRLSSDFCKRPRRRGLARVLGVLTTIHDDSLQADNLSLPLVILEIASPQEYPVNGYQLTWSLVKLLESI